MIEKSKLQAVISQYYLEINESVIWKVKDNILTIRSQTPSKEVIAEVTLTGFDLEDSELAIYDTKKLLNLINICDEKIQFKLDKDNTKINLSDSKFKSIYPLSSPLLITTPQTVNNIEWDVEVHLAPIDIENMIKAKKALADINHMVIETSCNERNETTLNFTFGEESEHNNKVTYTKGSEIQSPMSFQIPFNSDFFKAILSANKEAIIGKIFVSKEGIMKLEFNHSDINSEYFIVRKQATEF